MYYIYINLHISLLRRRKGGDVSAHAMISAHSEHFMLWCLKLIIVMIIIIIIITVTEVSLLELSKNMLLDDHGVQ